MFKSKFLLTILLIFSCFTPNLLAETNTKESSFLEKFNNATKDIFFFDMSFGIIKKTNEQGEVIYQKDKNGSIIYEKINGKIKPLAKTVRIPFLVAFLAIMSIIITLYFRFTNVRLFPHAISILRGKYDNPNSPGELSHFRALMSALSGTIGLGNIAGVAIAISHGGPGALFWMFCLSFFGMSCKFLSTTLALNHRRVINGEYSGGPMYFLKDGLRKIGWAKLGTTLALLYSIFLIFAALGACGMFQANQAFTIVEHTFKLQDSNIAQPLFSIIFIIAVGAVIFGGIKRIGQWTSKIVPIMCGIYLLASLIVIVSNISSIPTALSTIFENAFTSNAMWGGIWGVLIVGFQRAAFSNEAGIGSASIVHANAKTNEPIREGLVAMVGPVIDTMIVCTSTALVIIITGAYKSDLKDIAMTSEAFSSVITFFPYILTICVILFAYSTCIAWFHYLKKGWFFILEELKINTESIYLDYFIKIIFLLCIYIGISHPITDILNFSDMVLLAMAFPNLIGCIILAKQVRSQLQDYTKRYKNNEFKVFK